MAKSIKGYTLKHKNISVADLKLDIASGAITEIGTVYEADHIPVGIPVKRGMIDRSILNQWWRGRAIPASRSGIREALVELKVSDPCLLPEKCLGLSLSDQYWICPAGSGLLWEEVNFFENSFSEDVGNILFGNGSGSRRISLVSPDNTSDGWLKKKWKIIDGKRCLLKGGSGATQQEPYNEVLASRIMERLGICHVAYSLLEDGDYPYSLCEDFVTPDTELITAWHMMQRVKKPNHVSVYRHYLDCCESVGLGDIRRAVDEMIVLDYIIVNEDRHLNNFGVVRRADTLEYIGAAPIYDSGTSLWFDKPVPMISPEAKMTCKPFKNSHEEQIKLVTDFSWLDFSALNGIDEELRELVKDSLFIDEIRCQALCRGLTGRIRMLERVALSAKKQVFIDNVQFDVEQDVAYSGEREK